MKIDKLKVSLFIGILLFVIMRWPLMDIMADEKNENEKYFLGSGSSSDPYLIESYEDICKLRDMVDMGNSLSGLHFLQTANLVFPEGEIWNGIGEVEKGYAFSGIYNGNGYTISNIYCEEFHAGLFSYLAGEVRNLGIESGVFKGSYIGSITSHGTSMAKIINCYNKAEVIAKGRAGGIVDNCPGIIMFCWNFGEVINADGAKAITAGLCSYGSAKILYSYALNTDKLVDDTTFTGSLDESYIVNEQEIDNYMQKMYEGMWFNYSLSEEHFLNTSGLINLKNTIFMRYDKEEIGFDEEFKPDIFEIKSQEIKTAFLECYNSRYEFEGLGTKDNPFIISSYEDLVRLRDCVDIGVTYANYYFKQTEDIYFPKNENWNPIGELPLNIAFQGTYDGAGHCLYNIYSEQQYAGLFVYLDGEVINLGIESGSFSGDTAASITIQGTENAKIINCYNKADVLGKYRAGGLADNYYGKVMLSWNAGNVKGGMESAAVAGICSNGSADIQFCYSVGDVDLVYIKNFNGTLRNSERIGLDEVERCVNDTYNAYISCDNDSVVTLDKINYLVYDDEGIAFQKDYVPTALQKNILKGHIPTIIMLILAVWCCSYAIRTLVRHNRKENKRSDVCLDTISSDDEKGIINKKTVSIRCCSVVLTIVLGTSLLAIVNKILSNKNYDGIAPMQNYYEQNAGTVDVLLVGNSRIGINIDGEVLWNEYGISAYNLWGNTQPIWNSFYFIEEAFRVNKPQVVVLEVSSLRYDYDYFNNHVRLTNTSGISNLVTKINAVTASCTASERLDYILGLPLYNARYLELSEDDFKHFCWNRNQLLFDKGFHVLYGEGNFTASDDTNILEYCAIKEKYEYYLYQIIELCKKNEVSLTFVKTQIPFYNRDMMICNTVDLIAEENNIPFVDFSSLIDEIDFVSSDFYTDGHLNTSGARKHSEYLGKFLMENYDLVDHRGDEKYRDWDIMANNLQNEYIRLITDNEDYFEELRRDGKQVMAFGYGVSNNTLKSYETLVDELESLDCEIWDMHTYGHSVNEEFVFGSNILDVQNGYAEFVLRINGDKITLTAPGILLVVYDETTDTVIDVTSFTSASGFDLKHVY